VRRVAIIASASGNGKTALGRRLARRLDVPFVELDSLVHGPDWQETSEADLRRQLEPILASDGWVIDGEYLRKIGTLVLDAADTVAWLDLPTRVWFVRLLRRTGRRLTGRERLWNDNKESLETAFWGRESLFGYALAERGDEVRSLIRNPDHADDVRDAGGDPVVCDLEEADDALVTSALRGADAVVFAAGAGPGSGPQRKDTMDLGSRPPPRRRCPTLSR
jgi:adenylate kinase family enzyme